MVPGSFLAARPTWSTRSSRPGTTPKPLRQVSERSSMEILSAPPSSNQWTMSSTLAPPTRDSNVLPAARRIRSLARSEEHTSELQSRLHLVCRLLLEKKKKNLERECTMIVHRLVT